VLAAVVDDGGGLKMDGEEQVGGGGGYETILPVLPLRWSGCGGGMFHEMYVFL
jgi:hypothetical protein